MPEIGQKAEDIMSTDIIKVKSKDSIHMVSKILTDNDTSGAPVIDEIGRIVGVISEHDIVAFLSSFDDTKLEVMNSSNLPRLAHIYLQASTKPIEDIMITEVITAEPDATIEDLAAIMTENNINRVPIVEKGKLLGIVSRIDILRNIGQVALGKV